MFCYINIPQMSKLVGIVALSVRHECYIAPKCL
jgi:hypothetical protein